MKIKAFWKSGRFVFIKVFGFEEIKSWHQNIKDGNTFRKFLYATIFKFLKGKRWELKIS